MLAVDALAAAVPLSLPGLPPSLEPLEPPSLAPSLPPEPLSVPDPPSPLDDPDPDSPPRLLELEALDARRSFLAQPDPLKWMVGGVNAFLMGPLPQTGQVVGESAWTPWMTSNRVPQAAQS